MTYWKLIVEGFGKINKAEIELAPMTLIVGDNNSGKSYLLSLAWAVRKLADEIFSQDSFSRESCDEADELRSSFQNAIERAKNTGTADVKFRLISSQLEMIMNRILERRKEWLINRIFNSDCVNVKRIALKMPVDSLGTIRIDSFQNRVIVQISNKGVMNFSPDFCLDTKELADLIIQAAAEWSLSLSFVTYMPAARTGFMMSKDIINKYARKQTFARIEADEQQAVQPFALPVLDFLDVMNDLSQDQAGEEKYKDIAAFIQRMTQGNVEISGLPSHELSYVPDGGDKKYPFRAVSAVVTELAPLLLMLSHQKKISGLFYEEPEMCLHPALQKRMGQVLARLVNAGADVVATTHSDIILQHINNMIRLKWMKKDPKDYGFETADLIEKEKVRVYQMSGCKDGTTEVKELRCSDNGFAVPTFNDALDDIMEDVIQIQS